MKKFVTIQKLDLSKIKVTKPESPYGFIYADYLTWNFKERIEFISGRIFKLSPAPFFVHHILQTLKHMGENIFNSPVKIRLTKH